MKASVVREFWMEGEGHAIAATDSYYLIIMGCGDCRVISNFVVAWCADEDTGEFACRFGLVKAIDSQVRLEGVGLVSVGVSADRGVDERLTTILWVGK
jgi:hypothetical protein